MTSLVQCLDDMCSVQPKLTKKTPKTHDDNYRPIFLINIAVKVPS